MCSEVWDGRSTHVHSRVQARGSEAGERAERDILKKTSPSLTRIRREVCVYRQESRHLADTADVLDYLKCVCNVCRRRSTIGDDNPVEFELLAKKA